MLDFSNIRNFEITLNEETLNLLPPKLKQVDEINEFVKKYRTTGVQSQEMAKTAALILNNNKNNKTFDIDRVAEFEYDIIYSIIFGYIAWINEIQTNPNLYSPSAQE